MRFITELFYLSVNARFGDTNAKTLSGTDITVIEGVKIVDRGGSGKIALIFPTIPAS